MTSIEVVVLTEDPNALTKSDSINHLVGCRS